MSARPTHRWMRLVGALAIVTAPAVGVATAAHATVRESPPTGTTITVNTTADDNTVDGNCSLREALQAADTDQAVDACPAGSGNDTIVLAGARYTLTHGPLEVSSDVTIRGDSVHTVLDGNAQCCTASRALHVNSGADLTLDGVSIQHSAPAVHNDGTFTMDGGSLDTNLANFGNLTNDDHSDGLANFGTATLAGVSIRYTSDAIVNAEGAHLTAYSVVFDHDDGSVDGSAGGVTVGNGGTMAIIGGGFLRAVTCDCVAYAILNGSTAGASLTIAHVRFADNAGIDVLGNSGTDTHNVVHISDSAFDGNTGLPIENTEVGAALTMTGSRMSGNRVTHSRPGAVLNEGGNVAIDHSTIDHNVGDGSGGILNRDPIVFGDHGQPGGHVTLTNDTLADNLSRFDTGSGKHFALPSGALTNAVGTAMIRNTTIASNSIVGFHDLLFHAGGIVTMPHGYTAMSNSILSDNTAAAPVQSQDCFGPIHSLGFNLVENSTDCFLGANTTGNIIGVSAHLRPLAANGGPTTTLFPPWDSPVVDAGNPAAPNDRDATACATTDERFVNRARDGNADGIARCDMGAVER